ncbi:hypothetical protein [Nonomuraea sp. CA-141351]|uniref:hypothetical protein n=1 Tax=Nonomuraea sp. CA-141351 TaxID=3239996 RepID=UPI003D9480A5
MTDAKPPAHLRPARAEQVAGGSGTGRDTAGGASAKTGAGAGAHVEAGKNATGVGTAGAHARLEPAAELGFSGDPGQHDDTDEAMLHAQRTWDGTLATNRLDALGVDQERRRMETKDVTVSVSLLVDGWPVDVRKSVQSVIDHTNAQVLALDLGNIEGSGDVLNELADRYPDRIAVWHVSELPHWRGGTATWGECRTKLLRLDEAEVHVLMETNIVLRGDALTPLVAAVVEGAVAAGWQGMEPVHEQQAVPDTQRPRDGAAGPGKVRALTGELMAVRRSAALGALPEDANYGRNADLELSLALHGELIVPEEPLPVVRLESHDVDPGYEERESKRNYDAVLHLLGTS